MTGFVAVGWSKEGDVTTGRVWTSANGIDWSAVAAGDLADHEYSAVTWTGGAYYAFATAPTTVWRSADGVTWEQVELPVSGGEIGTMDAFTGGTVSEAAFSGGYLYAAGDTSTVSGDIDCFCVAVWRSLDGVNWTQSIAREDDSFQAFGTKTGLAVVVSSGTYIGKQITYSDDIDAWLVPFVELGDSQGLLDAASDGTHVVAVGYDGDAFDKAIALITDGFTWTVNSLDADSGAPAEQVVWAGDRYVAVGTGQGVGVSWWSPDGVSWARGPDVGPLPTIDLGPEGGDDPFRHRTIGAGAPGVVLTETADDGLHVWFVPVGVFSAGP